MQTKLKPTPLPLPAASLSNANKKIVPIANYPHKANCCPQTPACSLKHSNRKHLLAKANGITIPNGTYPTQKLQLDGSPQHLRLHIGEKTSIRTANYQTKTKACDQKSQACTNWLPHMDSNHD